MKHLAQILELRSSKVKSEGLTLLKDLQVDDYLYYAIVYSKFDRKQDLSGKVTSAKECTEGKMIYLRPDDKFFPLQDFVLPRKKKIRGIKQEIGDITKCDTETVVLKSDNTFWIYSTNESEFKKMCDKYLED